MPTVKTLAYRLWITPRSGGGVELPIEVHEAHHLISILAALLALGDKGPLLYRIEPFEPLVQ